MALRDVRSGISSVNNDAYLDIQPSSTEEWAVHNIYFAGAVEMYFYDGSNELLFASEPAAGVYACHDFHCTNTRRIRVKNKSGSSMLIGYDGVLTHT